MNLPWSAQTESSMKFMLFTGMVYGLLVTRLGGGMDVFGLGHPMWSGSGVDFPLSPEEFLSVS